MQSYSYISQIQIPLFFCGEKKNKTTIASRLELQLPKCSKFFWRYYLAWFLAHMGIISKLNNKIKNGNKINYLCYWYRARLLLLLLLVGNMSACLPGYMSVWLVVWDCQFCWQLVNDVLTALHCLFNSFRCRKANRKSPSQETKQQQNWNTYKIR